VPLLGMVHPVIPRAVHSSLHCQELPTAKLSHHEETQPAHADIDTRGIGCAAQGVGEIWSDAPHDTPQGLVMLILGNRLRKGEDASVEWYEFIG
jgi:hypothetical protein